jgi:quinol monooxygenase YgiN
MRYGLFGTISAVPGKRDQLAHHLLEAAALLARNPDCIAYVVSTPDDDADAVSVFEVWTDEAAHDASLAPDDIRALIQQARPLIAGMSGGTRLTVLGGKGVPA